MNRILQNLKTNDTRTNRVQGNFFLDDSTYVKLGVSQSDLEKANVQYLLRKPKRVGTSVTESIRWLNTVSDYLDIENLILQQTDCDLLLRAWSSVNSQFPKYSHWDGSIRRGVLPPDGTSDMYLQYLRNQVKGEWLHDFLHEQDSLGLTLYVVLMWSGSVTFEAPPEGCEPIQEKTLRTLKKRGVEKGFVSESFGFLKQH